MIDLNYLVSINKFPSYPCLGRNKSKVKMLIKEDSLIKE